jgi:chromosome segregation ATPase
METNTEDDAALPLLVRKLAVFRKSLVRERGLRIDCEGEIQNLLEKLRLTSSMLQEKELVAMEYSKKCKELQGQIKEQQEIRSNEQKLEKIFSSFGTKKSIESENKLLKKEILSLKRNRKGHTQRIEELENELSKLQKQNATNLQASQSRVDMLERNLKEKEEDVINTKLVYENLKSKMRGLEKIKENYELERKDLLADRDAALIEADNERMEKQVCLKKLQELLNTNRVVEDMNNLEKDLNEKPLIRSRSNSFAGRRSVASFSKPSTHSRSSSIGNEIDAFDFNLDNRSRNASNKTKGEMYIVTVKVAMVMVL